MNKEPEKTGPDLQKKAERYGAWLKLVGVLYRLLIVAGLILLILVISAILFTSLFNLWLLVLPVSLIALGILLAWLEFKLHDRYFAISSKKVDRKEE